MLDFYKNKKVLITGHTGFKGSWMCRVLLTAGAKVAGYALEPPTEPSLFKLIGLDKKMSSPKECFDNKLVYTVYGDISDLELLNKTFDEVEPEIVIHMAAQPLVRESYNDPVGTYKTNVMGTVNVLECVRKHECVKSFINVTTDKVYLNREWQWGYRENEELNGYDPYSNSKSCSELVTSSYRNSFFGGDKCIRESGKAVAITTMRAGNVIGGGDFAKDRIIPDCVRAAVSGNEIVVRNPYSTRPYQHVLEPVMAYLMVAKAQYENPGLSGSYNIGPDDSDCRTTGDIATVFCEKWNEISRDKKAAWVNKSDSNAPHEANFLKLDSTKIKNTFSWKPVWTVEKALESIAVWYYSYDCGEDMNLITMKQIKEYIEGM